jgi:hypothetical protein
MGWSGGFGHISTDHNVTFTYLDDDYTYVDMSGSAHRLIQDQMDEHRFHTEDYSNLVIKRAVVSNDVVSWTITMDNGTIHTYGNMDSLATRWSLANDGMAGDPNADAYDELPYQWDLYSITDSDGDNQFTFSYQQDFGVLVNSSGNLTFYTRASYPKRTADI